VKKQVARLITRYASTYAQAGPGAARKMERLVKREWYRASSAERRALEEALWLRVRENELQAHPLIQAMSRNKEAVEAACR